MWPDQAVFSRQPPPIGGAWPWSQTQQLLTAVVCQQPPRQRLILSRVYPALAAHGRPNNHNDPCQLFLTWNLYLDLRAAGTNIQGKKMSFIFLIQSIIVQNFLKLIIKFVYIYHDLHLLLSYPLRYNQSKYKCQLIESLFPLGNSLRPGHRVFGNQNPNLLVSSYFHIYRSWII